MTDTKSTTRRVRPQGLGLRDVVQRTAVIDLDTLPAGQVVRLPGRHRQTWVRRLDGPVGAPTIVLLHGLFATADINWATSYQTLTKHYTVIAIDQEGHGRGNRTRLPFRLERCADDVAAVCRSFGVDRPIICGYSMGGPIAMLTWRRHRDLVAGLVLCATVSRFNGRQPAERAGLLAFAGGSALTSLVPRAIRRQAMGRVARRAATTVRGQWLIEQVQRQDLAAGLQAAAAVLAFDGRSWIPEIDVPTAVVVTTNDHLLAAARQRALANSIPGAVVVECAADHATIVEDGTPFPAALLEALVAVTTTLG